MTHAATTSAKRHAGPHRHSGTSGGREDGDQPTTLAYRAAVSTGLEEIIRQLLTTLGPSLLGLISGVDRKTVQRWNADRQPREPAEQRLRAAWQVYHVLLPVEDPQTIRQWFMGMNPDLDDLSPAEAIVAGDRRGVMAAARGFAVNG